MLVNSSLRGISELEAYQPFSPTGKNLLFSFYFTRCNVLFSFGIPCSAWSSAPGVQTCSIPTCFPISRTPPTLSLHSENQSWIFFTDTNNTYTNSGVHNVTVRRLTSAPSVWSIPQSQVTKSIWGNANIQRSPTITAETVYIEEQKQQAKHTPHIRKTYTDKQYIHTHLHNMQARTITRAYKHLLSHTQASSLSLSLVYSFTLSFFPISTSLSLTLSSHTLSPSCDAHIPFQCMT